ncbi:pentatricopeptide repeat-containing protein At1g62720-like [Mangifera indica]|uniref:pentatricopeptide repeat-containing protein At1g62720-like n=1 Tax=Mangifera indica TaxID=29780 RepID=UPI001CF95619|nr:pentatricopeptide repeat-containing protein At1g62720-like [Mangifera indica]
MFLKTSLVSSKSSFNVRFSSSSILSSLSQNQHTKSPPKHISTLKHHSQLYNFLRVNCRSGQIDDARRLFDSMASMGCKPDVFSYNILMEGLCLTNKIDDAKELLASMLSMGCTPDVVSYNTLIKWYCKNRKIDEALNLYEEMTSEGVRPNVFAYNTLLSGLFRNGNVRHAKMLFE